MAKPNSFDRWPPETKRDLRGGSPAPTLKPRDRKVAQEGFKIRIGTLNMNGGLNWNVGVHSESTAKNFSQWLDETGGILLLQDTGVVSEKVPGDVKGDFNKNNIVVWGNVDEAHASVAVAVHHSWKVRQRFQHPSVRALGVELMKGDLVLRVVSIYCPTNLDNTSNSENNPQRRLANELARDAIKWAGQVDAFVIGGDFNETSRPGDRVMGGTGKQKRKVRRSKPTTPSMELYFTLPKPWQICTSGAMALKARVPPGSIVAEARLDLTISLPHASGYRGQHLLSVTFRKSLSQTTL